MRTVVPEVLTMEQAAKVLRCTAPTVRRLIRRRRIRGVRLGRVYRVSAEALRDFMKVRRP
jgi:excisionase family DNA binding protein